MLVDYYAVLLRAVSSLEDNSPEMRRAVYDRARHMLADRFAQSSPTPTEAELRAEAITFDDAIERIEAEIAQGRHVDFSPPPPQMAPAEDDGSAYDAPATSLKALLPSRRPLYISGIAIALVVALFGVGYIAATSGLFAPARKVPAKVDAPKPQRTTTAAVDPDVDPAPGFDGGNTYAGLPFFYRRQPVYYRTVHPASTIVIDKSQHFLYLVQSNTVALRYGIAIGRECTAAHGPHTVAGKQEWPAWQPSVVVLNVRDVPAKLAGGPGNPLGARALDLDNEPDRIHGTNAPAAIGRDMLFGCVRLANDDIVDLYKRVAVGARVMITN